MKSDQVEYMRALTIAALADGEGTASSVAETMRTLAEANDHAVRLVRAISTQTVSGHLRSLQLDGIAECTGERKSRRHGRMEPTYRLSPSYAGSKAIPIEPDEDEAADRAQLETMSKPQLIGLIKANEIYADLLADFMGQLRDANQRARAILEANGLT